MSRIHMVPVSDIKAHPDNPRKADERAVKRLAASLKKNPDMMHFRPVVVDGNNQALAGNLRLEAARIAGIKTIPVLRADSMTAKERRRFVIADNVTHGQWDWDKLANEWEIEELDALGIEGEVFRPEYEPGKETRLFGDGDMRAAGERLGGGPSKSGSQGRAHEAVCPCCSKPFRFTY